MHSSAPPTCYQENYHLKGPPSFVTPHLKIDFDFDFAIAIEFYFDCDFYIACDFNFTFDFTTRIRF